MFRSAKFFIITSMLMTVSLSLCQAQDEFIPAVLIISNDGEEAAEAWDTGSEYLVKGFLKRNIDITDVFSSGVLEEIRSSALSREIPFIFHLVIRSKNGRVEINMDAYSSIDFETVSSSRAIGSRTLGLSSQWSFISSETGREVSEYWEEYGEAFKTRNQKLSAAAAELQASAAQSSSVPARSLAQPETQAEEQSEAEPVEETVEEPVTEPASETELPIELPTFDTQPSEPVKDFMVLSTRFGIDNSYPLGSYRGLALNVISGYVYADIKWPDFPLTLGLQLEAGWSNEDNPYISTIIPMKILLNAGWEFQLFDGKLIFVPRIKAGLLLHYIKGDFNSADSAPQSIFTVDQYYGISTDLFVPVVLPSSRGPWFSLYLSPGFGIFPNQGSVGYEINIEAGVRLQFLLVKKSRAQVPED